MISRTQVQFRSVPALHASTSQGLNAVLCKHWHDFQDGDITEVQGTAKTKTLAGTVKKSNGDAQWAFDVNSPPVGSTIQHPPVPSKTLPACQATEQCTI